MVEIPLAQELLVAVDGKKHAELTVDLQKIELMVDQQVVHVLEALELLMEIVVLENVEKYQQQVVHILLEEKAQTDH